MAESRKHQISLKNGRREGEDDGLALVKQQVGSAVQNTAALHFLHLPLCTASVHTFPHHPMGSSRFLGRNKALNFSVARKLNSRLVSYLRNFMNFSNRL